MSLTVAQAGGGATPVVTLVTNGGSYDIADTVAAIQSEIDGQGTTLLAGAQNIYPAGDPLTDGKVELTVTEYGAIGASLGSPTTQAVVVDDAAALTTETVGTPTSITGSLGDAGQSVYSMFGGALPSELSSYFSANGMSPHNGQFKSHDVVVSAGGQEITVTYTHSGETGYYEDFAVVAVRDKGDGSYEVVAPNKNNGTFTVDTGPLTAGTYTVLVGNFNESDSAGDPSMSYTISAPNSAPAFAESADSALEIVLVAESDDQDLSALNMNGVDVVDLDGHTGVLIGTDQLSVATTGGWTRSPGPGPSCRP